MHYSELHGDLPINAIQAFGGYLAMGGEIPTSAVKLIEQHKGNLKKAFKVWLDTWQKYTIPFTANSDAGGYSDGLLKFVDAAGSKFPSAKANEIKALFAKPEDKEYWFSGKTSTNKGMKEVEDILVKATKLTQEGIDDASGMSMTTKILIGVGIAAVVGGGVYYYKTRNDA